MRSIGVYGQSALHRLFMVTVVCLRVHPSQPYVPWCDTRIALYSNITCEYSAVKYLCGTSLLLLPPSLTESVPKTVLQKSAPLHTATPSVTTATQLQP